MKKLSIVFLILYIVAVVYLWILRFSNVDMTGARFVIEYWLEYLVTILFLILHFVFKFLDYRR